MKKLIRTTGWALAAAGALGLNTTLQAQTAPGATPAAVAADRGRLAELKVELGWTGDPQTFSCPLQAHAIGVLLEVKGAVPSESVRQQALRIARAESGLRVVDSLEVKPKLPRAIATQPVNVLERHAHEALAQAVPQAVPGVTVSVWTKGQVLVKGTVDTYEDKLAVSRCLRKVEGCTCVVNQLRVSGTDTAVVRRAAPRSPAPVASSRPAPAAPTVIQARAEEKRPATAPAATPAYSTGVVIIEETDRPTPSTPPVTPARIVELVRPAPLARTAIPPRKATAFETHMQQRIAAACGKAPAEVEVVARSQTDLTVRIKARDQHEGEAVASAVFQMPELVPCKVALDVQVNH